MCDYQIPFPAIQGFDCITLNVPFRMTAGTILHITRVCFMPQSPECFANFLRFFASYQNFRALHHTFSRTQIAGCIFQQSQQP